MTNFNDFGYVGKKTGTIKASSMNGYNGEVKIFDRIFTVRYELFIYDAAGREVFHAYSSNIKTKEDLIAFVEDFPRFRREMGGGK